MKNILTFLLILLSFQLIQAQKANVNSFNLPPRVVLSKKGVEVNDLSYKLNDDNYMNNEIATNFLRKFTESELKDMENSKGEDFFYYKSANEYFNSLSEKIRKIYSYDELWYIYMFDQKLKQKLTTIQ
jgi:hypothetical protein